MKISLTVLLILGIFTLQYFSQTSKFIETDGLKTHYLEWGKSKKTIILIHGLTGDAEIWKDFAPLLAKEYRVIAPDRRGAGASDKPSEKYDAETLADDIAKFLEALKIENPIIVAHSFGGNAALTFAAKYPKKAASLILIEGGFWKKQNPQPIAECAEPIEKDCLISNALKVGMNEYDAESLFPKVSAPTLLVLGLPKELNKTNLSDDEKEFKKFFDEAVDYSRNVAKHKLKKGKIVIIENAGHEIFKDQPKILAKEIASFIEKNESRRIR